MDHFYDHQQDHLVPKLQNQGLYYLNHHNKDIPHSHHPHSSMYQSNSFYYNTNNVYNYVNIYDNTDGYHQQHPSHQSHQLPYYIPHTPPPEKNYTPIHSLDFDGGSCGDFEVPVPQYINHPDNSGNFQYSTSEKNQTSAFSDFDKQLDNIFLNDNFNNLLQDKKNESDVDDDCMSNNDKNCSSDEEDSQEILRSDDHMQSCKRSRPLKKGTYTHKFTQTVCN